MSARTIHNTYELVAAVPLDKVEIVNGPQFRRIYDIIHQIDVSNPSEFMVVSQFFTLKTLASDSPFQRKLHLTRVYDYDEQEGYAFYAFFCGKIVSGRYSPRTRTGWFSLD